MIKCAVCNIFFTPKYRQKTWKYEKGERVTCSKGCFYKSISIRMKKNNPMKQGSCRQRVSDTLKKIGHKPVLRMGNGTGLTKEQQKIIAALKKYNPIAEYVVKTNLKNTIKKYRPHHYKIDVAFPDSLVAVEVDGHSHGTLARQLQDKRKTLFLEKNKWTVIRFKNEEVALNLSHCIDVVEGALC